MTKWLAEYNQSSLRPVLVLQRHTKAWIFRNRLALIAQAYARSDDPAVKKVRHRNMTIHELITSEASFGQSLQRLQNFFIEPLAELAEDMLCGEYTLAIHDDVFGDLPLLMETQEKVQGILTKAWDAFPSVRVGAALQEVAEAAHDAYVPYISMYPTCLGKLQEIRKVEAVSAILHDAETKEGASIDSLLITPIQRMPRYRLLLKSLLKQTAADHVDHSALQQALHAVENTASRLNRAVKPIVSLLHRRTGSRR